MAVLVFCAPDGSIQEYDFSTETRIGTAAENALRLPHGLSVASRHAVISRSELFQVPVLVDLTGESTQTRVNGRRVVWLKALRHRDYIELGDAHLVFWEMMVREVAPGSSLIGKRCLLCYESFRPGDQVIACPRCQSPHHKGCWFYLSTCSYYGCGYPAQEAMRRALATWVHFEKLEEESKLVQDKVMCAAGNPRDQSPFKQGEHVAYCPNCETPFHIECWFVLEQCPKCKYEVAKLIEIVFVPSTLPDPALQEEPGWVKR